MSGPRRRRAEQCDCVTSTISSHRKSKCLLRQVFGIPLTDGNSNSNSNSSISGGGGGGGFIGGGDGGQSVTDAERDQEFAEICGDCSEATVTDVSPFDDFEEGKEGEEEEGWESDLPEASLVMTSIDAQCVEALKGNIDGIPRASATASGGQDYSPYVPSAELIRFQEVSILFF